MNTKISGISLIEVMFYILIVAISLTTGMSYLANSYKSWQMRAISADIQHAIIQAKVKAVTTKRSITLKPLDSDFSKGLVLQEGNSDTIRVWSWPKRMIKVTWLGFHKQPYLEFSPSLSNRTNNGYFLLTSPNIKTIKLTINRFARVKIS